MLFGYCFVANVQCFACVCNHNVCKLYVFIFECEGVHACMCVCCMSVRGDVFPFVVHIVYVFTTSALK